VNHHLPPAILLDLDDTILNDSEDIHGCWREACLTFRSDLGGIDPVALHRTIDRTREWFWGDPGRHREGRLDLDAASRKIVELSLFEMGAADPILAGKIAAKYRHQREAGLRPFPDAIDTVRWLRACGCRLALVTNGNGETQRRKLLRFGLVELFDSILIEGELGFGKPDPRIYAQALQELAAVPAGSWMVGDNLEFDVAQPQSMGMLGIWIDVRGEGLPETSKVRPHRILRGLSELREGPRGPT
jgi:putative hydrolase of the HAD superfamily